MNKKIIIVIYMFLFVAIGGLLLIKRSRAIKQENLQSTQEVTLTPQSNSEGSVTVEVTQVSLSNDSKNWQFDIALNTHSIDLSQDLKTISILKDDRGKEYKPLDWSGASPGGHHRQGVLTFQAISPRPSFIELVIKDIGGISERKFTWDLKE